MHLQFHRAPSMSFIKHKLLLCKQGNIIRLTMKLWKIVEVAKM